MTYTYPDTYMHIHTHKFTQIKIQSNYVQDEYMYSFASVSSVVRPCFLFELWAFAENSLLSCENPTAILFLLWLHR